MASAFLSLLFRRRRHGFSSPRILTRRVSTTAPQPQKADSKPHPATSSLSARLSFVFDHLDSLDREREAKDQALHRLRSWHQSHPPEPSVPDPPLEERGKEESIADVFKREVELVHPWPEWIELMERLAGQKYFELGTRSNDEDQFAKDVGIDLSSIRDETGYDFSRDWITVRNACMNFGRDRFDILRSLARKDLQTLVGHGCPSLEPKVVFSAKLLRKYVHIDEGDVCSSCNLRNTCGRGYILTRKEDEARTLDVMRILLTYGFDHVKGTVENKPLTKMKSVKTVLSAVPIDPNLPPPVIKKPPPKVKQPPPPPKKRVGRDDVEMKKGDWLCPKCDFMNFAKNTVCLQCDAKRPKRQLLPGEWECPKCNFLNYRRNMACFHCEHQRPPDEYTENQMQSKESGPRKKLERSTRMSDVSNAWNFDFDDNESDGADVAAFEFADSSKLGEDSSVDGMPPGRIARGFDSDFGEPNRMARPHDRGRFSSEPIGKQNTTDSSRTGFDDFDDEEDGVDNYELDVSNNNSSGEVSRKSFSEFERTSDSEDLDDLDHYSNRHSRMKKSNVPVSEDVGDYIESEDDLRNHPHWRSSHIADSRQKAGSRRGSHPRKDLSFGSDDDLISDIDDDDDDDDDDMDEGLQSKQRNVYHRDSLGRKGTRRANNSDSDDGLLLDTESDDDDNPRMRGKGDKRGSARSGEFRSDDRMHNGRNSFGYGNRDNLGRKGTRRVDDRMHNGRNSFGYGNPDNLGRKGTRRVNNSDSDDGVLLDTKSDDDDNPRMRGKRGFSDKRGSARSREFQSNDRMHNGRNSFGYGNRDASSRGSGRSGRDRWKEDDRFHGDKEGFRPRQRGRTNQIDDRPRDSRRNGRSPPRNGNGGWRADEGFQRFDRPAANGRGFRNRQHGKRTQFADHSGDLDEERASRRVIER
ncbi:hypothetical protein J5N97_018165 [Dioscorea zingiberensis]|uniref:RanBP2-type domain-containing protein n=1 Tax=Dioscorea zingiberensis TaxID=325984 RepID=A0A9D5HH12_9LILI|nr:hypothetical protein J5N97_018165 [Dioscorea zingiberensis]